MVSSFLFHFNDLIIVQAWLLYRRDSRETGVPAKEQMAICDFKLHIAECLKPEARKQGRTSVDLEMKKRKGGALPFLKRQS